MLVAIFIISIPIVQNVMYNYITTQRKRLRGMTKKVHFYVPKIFCNNQATRTPIRNLLNNVNNIVINDRLKLVNDEYQSVIQYRGEVEKQDINDNYLCLGKYRNKKPKQGQRGTERLEDIPNDVIEPISIYHRNVDNLFMFDYNHFGPRKNSIENYFSSFLQDNDQETWDFKLLPIENDFNINEIWNSEEIKSIEISFSRDNNLNEIFQNENNNGVLGPIIQTMISINEFMNNGGGNIADFKISNGRLSQNHLNQETLRLVIRLLLENLNESFKKIKVRYKPVDEKTKEIDLVDYGLYTSEIDRDNTDAWEYIVDGIENKYIECRNELTQKIRYIEENLNYTNREYYF